MNSSNGLPQSSIHDITQDKSGFLWLSSEEGIIRYDGVHTEIFRHDPDNPDSIPENYIKKILVDNENNLWIGSLGNGLVFYNQSKNKFQGIGSDTIGNYIHAQLQAKSGEILVYGTQGLFKITPGNFTITQLLDSKQLDEKIVAGIWQDERNTLWIATEDGSLYTLNTAHQLKTIAKIGGTFTNLRYSARYGLLLTSEEQGILQLQPDNATLKPFFAPHLFDGYALQDVAESAEGDLWISSHNGLFYWQHGTKALQLIQANSNDERSLAQNDLSKLFIDTRATLWIGTKHKGLDALHLTGYGFNTITAYSPICWPVKSPHLTNQPLSPKQNLSDSNVWSLLEDQQKGLWIGSNSGLDYRAFGEKDFKSIQIVPLWTKKVKVRALVEIGDTLWIGTSNLGLIAYSLTEQRMIKQFTPTATIRLLLHDPQRQVLWIGSSSQGLLRLDLMTDQVTSFQHQKNNPSSLPDETIRALYLAPDQRLWVGTADGLALFNDSTNTFTNLGSKLDDASTLSDEDVRAIYQVDQNTLWVATGNGLNKVDLNTFSVSQRLGEKQGLPSSTLYTLIPDKQQRLWISTTNGLSAFSPATLTFSNYYVQHNLQDNEFNFNAWFQNKQGEIYVGGGNGVTYFNPASVTKLNSAAKPIILGVDAFDSRLKQQRLANLVNQTTNPIQPLSLAADLRRLRFSFTHTGFNSALLRYRLVGLDQEWTSPNPEQSQATYTNLSQGIYQFELATIPTLGEPTSSPKQTLLLPFTIAPYFWETLWFKMMLGLIGLSLLLSIVYYREQSIKKRLIESERILHYRHVVHELKAPLLHTRTALQKMECTMEIASAKSSDEAGLIRLSQKNINRSLSFIEQLHSFTHLKELTAAKHQDYLLEELVDEALLPFLTQTDASTQQLASRILLPDYNGNVTIRTFENSLYLIITNLLSNALKYAPPDSPIELGIKVINKDLSIECSNQGEAIPEFYKQLVMQPHKRLNNHNTINQQGLGLGLHIIKTVALHHHGSLSINTLYPSGNQFVVFLKNVLV